MINSEEARLIIARHVNVKWRQDDILERLAELMEPPAMAVPIEDQIEWQEAVIENIPRLFHEAKQSAVKAKMNAALETLRWVQSLQK